MADADGLHVQEPPLGYLTVIRCLNITWINPINETTHFDNWIGSRKGGHPPLPCHQSDVRHLVTSAQQSTNTSEILFAELRVLRPMVPPMTIECLLSGLTAFHNRGWGGLSSALWMATTFG